MELEAGFYIVDGNGNLKTKVERKVIRNEEGKREGFEVLTVPIRFRTIGSAKDTCLFVEGAAVLCVVQDGFIWGE